MNIETLLVYTTVTFFYVTSPGPAIILAIVNGLRADMKIVMISSLANIIGLFILSTASILGLGVILKTSSTLFMIVKILGALYLIYLGYKFLRNKGGFNISDLEDEKIVKSKKSYFLESFILAVTNPKPILFFTAIFPQFLDLNSSIAPQFFIMTGIFLFISFSSLCTYSYISKKSKAFFKNQRRINIVNKITGGLFIFMGLGLLKMKNQ
ncbi:LysE family translocator [Arcobacter sp. YIC-310]|uniref:LysE family translocator n=1 Tax=Arcobacter sp. YIC-310 TaxID=3376632 RepID=UPI003C17C65E